MLVRMAHNNAWANYRLARAVAQLDERAYRDATRTSFFPSIHLTLVHILFVDLYYVDGLEAAGRGAAIWTDEDRFARDEPFAAVDAAQRAVDRRLIAFTESLRAPADLEVEVRLERRDRIQVDARASVLLHLLEHQLHHRGQVHAMLSGTSVAPPQLDEYFLRDDLPPPRRSASRYSCSSLISSAAMRL